MTFFLFIWVMNTATGTLAGPPAISTFYEESACNQAAEAAERVPTMFEGPLATSSKVVAYCKPKK